MPFSLLNTIAKDIKFIFKILLPVKLRIMYFQIFKRNKFSYLMLWNRTVKKFPSKIALRFKNSEYTYAELDDLANRFCTAFLKKFDINNWKGRHVAIFGENNPTFQVIVLGLFKLNLIPFILRPSLGQETICEYIQPDKDIEILILSNTLKNKFTKDFFDLFENIHTYETAQMEFKTHNPIDTQIIKANTQNITLFDECFYIGTSATTGTSKACCVHHGSILAFIYAHINMKSLTHRDKLYTCITLSHGEGFAVTMLTGFTLGTTILLEEEFKPNKYLETYAKNSITVMSYAGMMPRQLLKTPPSPYDQEHSIRVASGHEMLGSTWKPFQERFAIPTIVEYFAASEGGYFFVNDTQPGKIGFAGPLTKLIYPFKILKIDKHKHLMQRDGRPVECAYNEPGELFVPIKENDPTALMNHYASEAQTNSVLHRNLFKQGDVWFATGEILSHDRSGYLHFVGKKSVIKYVNNAFLNPQYIEDKILSLDELYIDNCLAHFIETKDNSIETEIVLQAEKHFDDSTLRDKFSIVLDDTEMPDSIRYTDIPLHHTDTLRNTRSKQSS